MDRNFYLNLLYPFQDQILRVFRSTDTEFHLTGGTALSRGYLNLSWLLISSTSYFGGLEAVFAKLRHFLSTAISLKDCFSDNELFKTACSHSFSRVIHY